MMEGKNRINDEVELEKVAGGDESELVNPVLDTKEYVCTKCGMRYTGFHACPLDRPDPDQ